MDLAPLQVPSLKAACITRLEQMILTGEFKIGEKLPSERKLAESLQVSRPVVHEALVDLAAKGLVEILPRRGVVVKDFRTSGSCALLSTLLAYHEGELDPAFLESLIAMRLLIETETARLAAQHRTPAHLERLQTLIDQELQEDRRNLRALAALDYDFHLEITLASGNLMYPLILNSFKGVYMNITGKFFDNNQDSPAIEQIFTYHQALHNAIADRESETAGTIMAEMLCYAAEHLQS